MNTISNYYATRKDSIDIPIANELALGKVVVIDDSNPGGTKSFLSCSDKNCGWKCKYSKIHDNDLDNDDIDNEER